MPEMTPSTSASAIGRKPKLWHRERIVASIPPGRCEITMNIVSAGGSSSVFKSALAELTLQSSTLSMMATRYPALPRVWWSESRMALTSSTRMAEK
jgi:hypothetical protein